MNTSFKVGDRVTWKTYGMWFTGTVVKVFEQDTVLYKAGDLQVRTDADVNELPRLVPVIPGRTVKHI